MKQKYILLLIFTFLSGILSAQNISVKSFRVLEKDMDARISHPKKDQNGELAAIIKVVTTETGFNWEGDALGIVDAVPKTGEYWVYVPWGAKRLTIKHPKLGILRDYAYPEAIKEATVYEMVLTTAKITTIVEEQKLVTQWLAIDTEPSGAAVYINDMPAGETPFFRKYEEGEYTYRIEKPRYHNQAGKVQLQGEKQALNLNLKPKFGNVYVETQPESGMTIIFDDKPTDKTSPVTLKEVDSGEHTIKAYSQWYKPKAQKITVTDEQTTDVSLVLEPAFAEINIKAEPSDADIFIDGNKKGTGTYTQRMLEGIYTIKVSKDKHYEEEKQLKVEAGKNENLTFNLKAKTGSIDVVSIPMDAQIYINGKQYGTTPNTIEDLLVGTYTVELRKTGYGTVSKQVSITENKTTEINETLPAGEKITITTNPGGAEIYINGTGYGITPYTGTLNYGTHQIKLINGKKTVNESITVRQGGKSSWEFDVSEFAAKGSFTDSRDGKTYKYVIIGKQVWMAENLNYTTNSGSWCYDNNSSNCDKYGRLYNWETAKKVCPAGWHLPSDNEWEQLSDFLGGAYGAGKHLKATSGWKNNGNGTDDYGFQALPGGSRGDNGYFYSIGSSGYWWSATVNDTDDAWIRSLSTTREKLGRYSGYKSLGFSVRCLRD